MNIISKKSSVTEGIIISNLGNYLWYFWNFYLFFLINFIHIDQSPGFFIRISYANIFALITNWGISLFGSRIISYTSSSNLDMLDIYKKLIFTLLIPIIIFIPFTILLALTEIISFIDTFMLEVYFYVLIHGIFLALFGFFEGLRKFRFSFLFSILKFLIDTILISFLLIFEKIYNLFLVMTFIDLFLLLFLFFICFKVISTHKRDLIEKDNKIPVFNNSPQISFLKQLKNEALPIAILTIVTVVSDNFSRLFIGLYISETILPTYIFSMSIILLIARTGNGFLSGLVPRLTELRVKELYNKSQNLIIKSCYRIEILMILGLLFVYFLYKPFSHIIFGSIFSTTSTELIKLVSISLIFLPLWGIFSAYFISMGKPKFNLLISLTSSITNILIIILLGPFFGLYAAIIGFLLSRGLYFIIPIVILQKLDNKHVIYKILKIFLYSLLLFVIINIVAFIFSN